MDRYIRRSYIADHISILAAKWRQGSEGRTKEACPQINERRWKIQLITVRNFTVADIVNGAYDRQQLIVIVNSIDIFFAKVEELEK